MAWQHVLVASQLELAPVQAFGDSANETPAVNKQFDIHNCLVFALHCNCGKQWLNLRHEQSSHLRLSSMPQGRPKRAQESKL
jgi:hypothetical protein